MLLEEGCLVVNAVSGDVGWHCPIPSSSCSLDFLTAWPFGSEGRSPGEGGRAITEAVLSFVTLPWKAWCATSLCSSRGDSD